MSSLALFAFFTLSALFTLFASLALFALGPLGPLGALGPLGPPRVCLAASRLSRGFALVSRLDVYLSAGGSAWVRLPVARVLAPCRRGRKGGREREPARERKVPRKDRRERERSVDAIGRVHPREKREVFFTRFRERRCSRISWISPIAKGGVDLLRASMYCMGVVDCVSASIGGGEKGGLRMFLYEPWFWHGSRRERNSHL